MVASYIALWPWGGGGGGGGGGLNAHVCPLPILKACTSCWTNNVIHITTTIICEYKIVILPQIWRVPILATSVTIIQLWVLILAILASAGIFTSINFVFANNSLIYKL